MYVEPENKLLLLLLYDCEPRHFHPFLLTLFLYSRIYAAAKITNDTRTALS